MKQSIVWNSDLVNKIRDRVRLGEIVSSIEHPFFEPRTLDVKKAGLAWNFNQEEIEEIVKCYNDVIYFAKNYCKIKTEDGSYRLAPLRDYQEDALNQLQENRFNILFWSRQTGKTIDVAITILHYILKNNKKNILIVANKGKTSKEIVRKLKEIYKGLPFFLKPGIEKWNESAILFDNGCNIITENRVKEPSVGFSIDFLYCDEFALIGDNIIYDYWENIWPVITSMENSKAIISSTPKGFNLFYELVRRASLNKTDPEYNDFILSTVYWHQVKGRTNIKIKLSDELLKQNKLTPEFIWSKLKEHEFKEVKTKTGALVDKKGFYSWNKPGTELDDARNIVLNENNQFPLYLYKVCEKITNWKQEQINAFGETAFARQFDLKFSVGSDMLFSSEIMAFLNQQKREFKYEGLEYLDKILPFPYDNLKWINDEELWNKNNARDYFYSIGVDVGEGLARDYSVINIFRICPMDKTSIEKSVSHTSYYDLFELKQVGIFHSNTASPDELSMLLYCLCFHVLDPEKIKIVLELNNHGLSVLKGMRGLFDGNNNFGTYIFARFKHQLDAKSRKPGIKTTAGTKPIMAREAKTAIENMKVKVYHSETLKEMASFVMKENTSGHTQFRAQVGHDDLVMSTLFANALITSSDWKNLIDMQMNTLTIEERNLLENTRYTSPFVNTIDYSSTIQSIKNNKLNKYMDKKFKQDNWTNLY